MTTSKKELAAMLIESDETGREVQYRNRGTGEWAPSVLATDFEYRLKPIIKYYRVWKWSNVSSPTTTVGPIPFPPFDEWGEVGKSVSASLIHDFEIEQ